MPAIIRVPNELKYNVGNTIINLGSYYGTVMKILPVNNQTIFIMSLYGQSPTLFRHLYNLSKTSEPYGVKVWIIDEKTPDFKNKMLA